MTYRNFIFDLYGTLVDIHTNEESRAFWRRMALLYAHYGADYTGVSLRKTYLSFVREAEMSLKKKLGTDYPEIRLEEVFLRLLREAPKKHGTAFSITDEAVWADVIANTFRVLSRKRLSAYPDTISTLEALRERGCHIYLLSNAQRIFTMPEIEVTGVAPYLEDIFISSDFGMKKPEMRFLSSLMQKHAMKPEETVMIGNDFESDMEIARKVGIDGIFVNSFAYDGAELKRRNKTGVRVVKALSELL